LRLPFTIIIFFNYLSSLAYSTLDIETDSKVNKPWKIKPLGCEFCHFDTGGAFGSENWVHNIIELHSFDLSLLVTSAFEVFFFISTSFKFIKDSVYSSSSESIRWYSSPSTCFITELKVYSYLHDFTGYLITFISSFRNFLLFDGDCISMICCWDRAKSVVFRNSTG
jgi:hypothetical protein